jgi:hypothetical protein
MAFRSWPILCEGVGLTIFIFGLLVWGYVVVIQVTHPEWLGQALSHHAFAPLSWRLDDIGIISFAVAPFGLLMWYLSRTFLSSSERRKK